MSIPASNIVQVVPSVLSAGGNPLALNGLILSNSPYLPVGAPISFPSAAAVLAYFGSYAWSGSITTVSGSNIVTVNSTASGVLAVNQLLQALLATGLPPGATITSFGTYTTVNGYGTINMNVNATASGTFSATSNSLEYNMAAIYFNGYTTGTTKPTALWFSRYTQMPIQAWLRGISLGAGATLAMLQAVTSGTLQVTINGSLYQTGALNLSGATSFSNAATLMTTALGTASTTSGTTVGANTVMTIANASVGVISVGQLVTGSTVQANTYVASLGTYNPATGLGTINLSLATSGAASGAISFSMVNAVVSSATCAQGSAAMTITTVSSGALYPGMTMTGTGIAPNTYILSMGTSTGGAGTLTLSQPAIAVITTAAVTGVGPQITWNSLFNAFVVTSPSYGATSTIAVGTSSGIATVNGVSGLGLTGASVTVSQGSAAMAPATAMATVILNTQNWAAFTPAFEPIITDKLAFAAWNTSTGGQFAYVQYDSDTTITSTSSSSSCLGYWCTVNSYNGVFPVFANALGGWDAAAFTLGFCASVNYNLPGGRAAITAKAGTGIAATILDPTSAANAKANNTNFYGAYATANYPFTCFCNNGYISGSYGFLDSYMGAIWLNAAIQLAEVNMMLIQQSIPYNQSGYTTINAAVTSGASSPVQIALMNGVINPGVPLTASQTSAVNIASGVSGGIAQTLSTRGYYFQVLPATGTQRANRTSPTTTLWYMDGGSVNQLNIASIDIQ